MKCENCKANKYCFDANKGVVECFVADDMVKMIDKVKADAIDELTNKFEIYVKSEPKQTYFYTEFLNELKRIAEKLKEQKDD